MGVEVILTASAIAGTVVAGAGAATQYVGQQQQTEASKRAEAARSAEMELESQRKQRDILRKSLIARSTALVNTTAQGAQEGSALPGAYAQIGSQTNQELGASRENLDIGRTIFSANADLAEAQGLTALGKSAVGFGTKLITQSESIGRIGSQVTRGIGDSIFGRNFA